MSTQQNYGNCQYCGASMAWSQRANKPYCSAKCWDKQPKPQFVKRGENLAIKEEPNWEAIREEKREAIDWLNARILAKDILIVAYQKGELASYDVVLQKLEETAKQIYGTKPTEGV